MPVICAACAAIARDISLEPKSWPRMPLPSDSPLSVKAFDISSKYCRWLPLPIAARKAPKS